MHGCVRSELGDVKDCMATAVGKVAQRVQGTDDVTHACLHTAGGVFSVCSFKPAEEKEAYSAIAPHIRTKMRT